MKSIKRRSYDHRLPPATRLATGLAAALLLGLASPSHGDFPDDLSPVACHPGVNAYWVSMAKSA